MNLLNKLSVGMARIGCAGLRNASKQNKDNLDYVKAVVYAQGARSFQFASDFVRSDANDLIEMVEIDPEILNYKSDIVYDRYIDSIILVEDEVVDPIVFALKCVLKDNISLYYLDKDIQDKVISLIQSNKIYQSTFNGKPFTFKAENFSKELYMFDLIADIVQNKVVF